jgi:hypothetical protein
VNHPHRAIACCLGVAAALATAEAHAVTYNINFDNYESLSWLYQQARDSFAYLTMPAPGGGLARCPVPPEQPYLYDDWVCWAYGQRLTNSAGTYWFDVYAYESQHYHLFFEDPAYINSCGFVNGGLVKKINGMCQPPVADYAAEPRYLAAHDNNAWITTSMQNASTRAYTTFKVAAITVLNTEGGARGGTSVPLEAWGLSESGNWHSQAITSTQPGTTAINFAIIKLYEFDVGPPASFNGAGTVTIGNIVVNI